MGYEIVDHIPGFTDEQVAEMVREAEEGYDLTGAVSALNPHADLRDLLPGDLMAAVDARAVREGRNPRLVLPDAIEQYRATPEA